MCMKFHNLAFSNLAIFKRLEELHARLYGRLALSNELVKIYFGLVQKLIKKINELIGYLEAYRWSREEAVNKLDCLVEFANEYLFTIEKFTESLERSNKMSEPTESVRASFNAETQ